jgi:hypothetical protein
VAFAPDNLLGRVKLAEVRSRSLDRLAVDHTRARACLGPHPKREASFTSKRNPCSDFPNSLSKRCSTESQPCSIYNRRIREPLNERRIIQQVRV